MFMTFVIVIYEFVVWLILDLGRPKIGETCLLRHRALPLRWAAYHMANFAVNVLSALILQGVVSAGVVSRQHG